MGPTAGRPTRRRVRSDTGKNAFLAVFELRVGAPLPAAGRTEETEPAPSGQTNAPLPPERPETLAEFRLGAYNV